MTPFLVILAAERIPLPGAILLVAIFWLGGALIAGFSWQIVNRGVGRNKVAGLRLASTLRSDAAWFAGQRAFMPWGVASGLAAALIATPILLRPGQGSVWFLASLASIVMVVLPAFGVFFGDVAAKDAAAKDATDSPAD